jgi:hypothetical protein
VINIGFDTQGHVPLPLSIRRYFAYEHYKPVLDVGAVRVARSATDLVELVRGYLREPTLDAAGRAQLVQEVCSFTDGSSGTRVGRAVLRALQNHNATYAEEAPISG